MTSHDAAVLGAIRARIAAIDAARPALVDQIERLEQELAEFSVCALDGCDLPVAPRRGPGRRMMYCSLRHRWTAKMRRRASRRRVPPPSSTREEPAP